MDFHDFPRFLRKSGVYLIHTPKLCAGLSSSSADPALPVARARTARAAPALRALPAAGDVTWQRLLLAEVGDVQAGECTVCITIAKNSVK